MRAQRARTLRDLTTRELSDMILAALLIAIAPALQLSMAKPAVDPFSPEDVLQVPNGPRVVRLPAPGSELVAMRLSVPVSESQREAGAARLLQQLSLQRLEGRAAVLGLHLEGARTPWGLSYTVAGARSDFEDLVALLWEVVAEPDAASADFERHRRAMREEMLRTIELPAARLGAELRARAAPNAPPLDGTPATLDRLTRVTLRDLWARTHRPSEMSVVVSGDVTDDLLLSAFRGMSVPRGGASDGASGAPPQPERGSTQVYRHWYGEAFKTDARDPHAAVATVLASDWLRASGEPFEAEVQLWETGDLQLITVVAAAYTGNSVALRQRMPRLLVNTRQALSADAVESAVARVRQDLLLGARTTTGLVNVVGHHLDATGEPGATRRFLNALDRVSLESTRAFLATLERQTPLRAEVRP
jgi:hypothetical protein